ncbi:hypothetical protein [Sedimenticola hydrogenitrophicus]|uniref:hypothetical protein n=1 Tax=Sedimenticola hydrogenitrophicus TaxID=2967975 RepID=UPI0023B05748|nr:hypothetical protein [Sedimenticola hydrogenitrophicus]
MELDALRNAVIREFDSGEFNGSLPLLYDEKCRHEECLYIETVFGRKHWVTVMESMKDIPLREDILFFFSSNAFVYYMPVFILSILDDYYNADVLPSTFLSILGDDIGDEKIRDGLGFGSKLKFTLGQIRVIISFANYLSENHNDTDATDFLINIGCK